MFQNDKMHRALNWASDLSLLACLFLEIVFAHTLVSQASMLVFFLFTALLMLRQKRVHLSWWMGVSALLILWSAVVSFGWAYDRAASLGMVKTLVVTTAFLFFLFQYLLLRADLKRFLAIYIVSALLMVGYLYAKEYMLPWSVTRLGAADGVHPNLVGLVSAFAFGACVVLAGAKRRLLWLIPIPVLLAAIALTVSFKSVALAGGLLVVLLLVRFPRNWGWKLGGLAVLGLLGFYVVVLSENPLSMGALAHVREVALFALKGEGVGGSTSERLSLIQAAWSWFAQRPLTGWGLGCFRFLEGSLGMYSHNNYMELLVSGGIPMALIYYAGQVGALVYAAREIKRAKANDPADEHKEERQMVIVFCVMFAARFVLDLAVVSYYERQDTIFFVLLIAAARLLSLSRGKNTERNLEHAK